MTAAVPGAEGQLLDAVAEGASVAEVREQAEKLRTAGEDGEATLLRLHAERKFSTWTKDGMGHGRWQMPLHLHAQVVAAAVVAVVAEVLLPRGGDQRHIAVQHVPDDLVFGVGPAGTLQLGVTQTLAEAGIGFWLSDHVQVYGGARYQDVDNEIGLGTGASSIGDSWVDGMLGLQLAPVASDHWLLWIRGDAGTGGSDLTWLFEAGAAYSWDDPYAIYCAYRMLDTDFQNDNFEYDMRQSGFLFGFGFRF